MAALRTFRLGSETHVVALRGELDCAAAVTAASEIGLRLGDGDVVVDLLGVDVADVRALDVLLPILRGAGVRVVAGPGLVDGRDLCVMRTLRAALA